MKGSGGATSEPSPFCWSEGQGNHKGHLGGLHICQKIPLFGVAAGSPHAPSPVIRQGLVLPAWEGHKEGDEVAAPAPKIAAGCEAGQVPGRLRVPAAAQAPAVLRGGNAVNSERSFGK